MRKRILQATARTTSGTTGGRRTSTNPATGKAGRGGRMVSRSQRAYDIKKAFGMSVG